MKHAYHHTIRNVALLSCAALLLAGCGLIRPAGPSARVNIQSAQYLNPDMYGNASPVVVTIYQLKTPYTFKQATYQALAANSSKVLGTDLIDKNVIEVRPNSHQTVYQPLSPNTQYLGIVAAYRNIDQSKWRTTVKVVNEKGKSTVINLDLESQALTATATHSAHDFGL